MWYINKYSILDLGKRRAEKTKKQKRNWRNLRKYRTVVGGFIARSTWETVKGTNQPASLLASSTICLSAFESWNYCMQHGVLR